MRHRLLALFLLLEALVTAVGGGCLLASTWLGPRAPRTRSGDVIGPPDAWLDTAAAILGTGAGAAALLLGVAGLVGGASSLQARLPRWLPFPVFAFALPWSLLAVWALFRAYESDGATGAWTGLSLGAATIALLHAVAARSCRPGTRAAAST